MRELQFGCHGLILVPSCVALWFDNRGSEECHGNERRIDVILDYLRDHGTIEREVESGPWLTVTWSHSSDEGDLRGTVSRLKEHDFRYARTLSDGTIYVRFVFGQEQTIVGGSADDVVDVAMRLSGIR